MTWAVGLTKRSSVCLVWEQIALGDNSPMDALSPEGHRQERANDSTIVRERHAQGVMSGEDSTITFPA